MESKSLVVVGAGVSGTAAAIEGGETPEYRSRSSTRTPSPSP